MIRSPCNEGPVGAVPESAHKEYDECVTNDLCLCGAAAAKWYVDIVSEPGGE